MDPTPSPNSPTLDEGPWARIVLNDLSKRAGIHTINSDITWHPSDVLKGHVIVSSVVDLAFDEIQISFEGQHRL